MKVACVGYRSWALNIYKNLAKDKSKLFLIIKTKKEFNDLEIIKFNPDLVLFYGWSWLIPQSLIKNFKCLMLHPSDLPKYRGGSPIQNQIINGVTDSKVSIFIMNEKLDAGDIVAQEYLSLEGNISEIFKRIEITGLKMTQEILREFPKSYKQLDSDATYFKRRTFPENEITLEEIKNKDSIYLYNKVRMLTEPYPYAYIKTIDGKFLIIKDVMISEDYPSS